MEPEPERNWQLSKKRLTDQLGDYGNPPTLRALQGNGPGLFAALADAFMSTPEALYRTLIEQIPAMTYISAPDDPGEVLFLSPQVEQQLGYSPEEWLRDPHFWLDRLHPDDRERVHASDTQAVELGSSYDLEYRLIHRDGHPVWIRDQGMLIRGEDGTPRCWLGFTLDMTAQKQTEQALLEAQERYRALVEQIPAVTFTVDVEQIHHPVYLSPQVESMLGYSIEEWQSDPEFWLTLIHPDDLPAVMAEQERASETGKPLRIEYRMITCDDRIVWVQNEAVLVRDANGEPSFWQGVLLDITDRKVAEEALREAEARYRTLVEQIPVVTFIEYPDGGGAPHFFSPQIESLLGRPPEQWRDNPALWLQSIHPDDLPLWQSEVERTDRTGDAFNLEHRMIAADGRIVWVQSSSQLVLDEEGRPQFWQGVLQDITDEVNAERRLAESEQRYRSLFQHNPDAVYSFDLDGNVRSANAALVEMTGYAMDEVLSMTFTPFIAPEDLARVSRHFALAAAGAPQDYECSITRKDGTWVEVHVTNLPIIVGGDIVGVYGIAKDISDRKKLENQLKHMAFHDPLTDLPNRALFMDRLEQALAGLERRSGSIAVLFMDLDNFKVVNDSLGHDAGDQVLIHIAGMIQSCIRSGDTASRLGGDEYTVLLVDVDGVDHAAEVSSRILECLGTPVVVGDTTIQITASIGVVVSSSHTDEPGDLLRDADLAMYQAKTGGKSRCVVFS